MTLKRILIISYHFPPGMNSQAQHVKNVAQTLSDYYDVTVLTACSGDLFHEDAQKFDFNIIYEKPGIFHKVSAPKIKDDRGSFYKIIKTNKIIHYFKKRLIPDSVIDWRKKAFNRAMSLTFRKDFDLIISVATPYTDLLVGDSVAKKIQCPHIAIYADPWYGEGSVRRSKLRTSLEKKLEEKILKNVDKAFFVTQNTMNYYKQIFPKLGNKFNYYYMGHSVDGYRKDKKIYSEKNILNINYFGALQSIHRNPFPFLDAVKEVRTPLNVNFFLVNHPSHKEIINFINQYPTIKRKVTIHSAVPYQEMLGKLNENGLNLIFGNKDSKQIPGKVFDYIGENTNILYLEQHPNDELNTLLERYDNCFEISNNEVDIADFLNSPIQNIKRKKSSGHDVRSDLYYKNALSELVSSIESIFED